MSKNAKKEDARQGEVDRPHISSYRWRAILGLVFIPQREAAQRGSLTMEELTERRALPNPSVEQVRGVIDDRGGQRVLNRDIQHAPPACFPRLKSNGFASCRGCLNLGRQHLGNVGSLPAAVGRLSEICGLGQAPPTPLECVRAAGETRALARLPPW